MEFRFDGAVCYASVCIDSINVEVSCTVGVTSGLVRTTVCV